MKVSSDSIYVKKKILKLKVPMFFLIIQVALTQNNELILSTFKLSQCSLNRKFCVENHKNLQYPLQWKIIKNLCLFNKNQVFTHNNIRYCSFSFQVTVSFYKFNVIILCRNLIYRYVYTVKPV